VRLERTFQTVNLRISLFGSVGANGHLVQERVNILEYAAFVIQARTPSLHLIGIEMIDGFLDSERAHERSTAIMTAHHYLCHQVGEVGEYQVP